VWRRQLENYLIPGAVLYLAHTVGGGHIHDVLRGMWSDRCPRALGRPAMSLHVLVVSGL